MRVIYIDMQAKCACTVYPDPIEGSWRSTCGENYRTIPMGSQTVIITISTSK